MTIPTVPILCILAAWFLVYFPHFIGGSQRARMAGGFDNKNPRDQTARLDGWAKRAIGAHMNGHETFAPFALAVIVACVDHADPGRIASLAITFVALRALYIAAYIGNVAWLRSLLWTSSLAVAAGLFLLPVLS